MCTYIINQIKVNTSVYIFMKYKYYSHNMVHATLVHQDKLLLSFQIYFSLTFLSHLCSLSCSLVRILSMFCLVDNFPSFCDLYLTCNFLTFDINLYLFRRIQARYPNQTCLYLNCI